MCGVYNSKHILSGKYKCRENFMELDGSTNSAALHYQSPLVGPRPFSLLSDSFVYMEAYSKSELGKENCLLG